MSAHERAGAAVAPPPGAGIRATRRVPPSVAAARRFALPTMATAALLALWEIGARAGVVLPDAIPAFSQAVGWLIDNLGEQRYRDAIGQTLWHWIAGWLVGSAAGIVVGVVLGVLPILHRLLNVVLEVLRPIPAIVYLPLLILVIGARDETAIVLAALGAFWPLLFQTLYGVRAIDTQAMETGKVFGLTRRQRLFSIMLPSVLPYVATGSRIASSLTLIVAISAELVGGIPGLGAELGAAAQNANYEATYGMLIVAGLLGLVINLSLERGERRLLRWHVSNRRTTS
jgi:ABC-type nitrate/sulfonate/bicarbonate transport system permease component